MLTAELAIVKIGQEKIEGLLADDGNFYIAVSQICSKFSFLNKNAQRDIKLLLGDEFQFLKCRTTLNSKAVNVIPLNLFSKLVTKLAYVKKNPIAIDWVDWLLELSLHQLFSDAFGQKFEAEDRQTWLKARQAGKVTRRTLTDAIKDYIARNNVSDNEGKWLYANVTEATYGQLFGRKTKQLKKDWGIGIEEKKTPRDYMANKELAWLETIEELTMRLIDNDNIEPVLAVKEAMKRLMLPVIER